jgi:hypothetical protein
MNLAETFWRKQLEHVSMIKAKLKAIWTFLDHAASDPDVVSDLMNRVSILELKIKALEEARSIEGVEINRLAGRAAKR